MNIQDPIEQMLEPNPIDGVVEVDLVIDGSEVSILDDIEESEQGGRVAIDPLAVFEGAAFVACGVWPLVSRRSFERVAGRQGDLWGVRALGLLSIAVGVVLLAGGRRPGLGMAALGGAGAVAMAAADVLRLGKGTRRRWPFMVDAATNVAVAGAWAMRARRAMNGAGDE